jgi:hypothetical protein
MNNKERNIVLNAGRATLMMLFFFLCISFLSKSEKSTYSDTSYEQLTELHAYTGNAVVSDFVQIPVYDKDLLISSCKTNFSFCNTKLRMFVYNGTIAQRINFLEQTILSLKPLSYCGFYYHLFSSDSRELPTLS